MSVIISGVGMVMSKRLNEVNGTSVLNLTVGCQIYTGKEKANTKYQCSVWGERGKKLNEFVKDYNKDTKEKGSLVFFSGELQREEVVKEKYINKYLKLNDLQVIGDSGNNNNQSQKTKNNSENKKQKQKEDEEIADSIDNELESENNNDDDFDLDI